MNLRSTIAARAAPLEKQRDLSLSHVHLACGPLLEAGDGELATLRAKLLAAGANEISETFQPVPPKVRYCTAAS